MSRSIFVRPVDAQGSVSGKLERVRAFHYTWVEQTFPVLDPPEEWVEMLKTALQLDMEVLSGFESDVCDKSASPAPEQKKHEECLMLYHTTPNTARDRQPCCFSKMRREHVHALIATSQMQSARCNRQIRDSCERVLWRYDADPTGRVPHAVYWGLCTQNATAVVDHLFATERLEKSGLRAEYCVPDCAPGSVLAMVREDESVVVAEPQGQSYVVHHWRRDGTCHQYHQSSDGELGLPPVILQRQREQSDYQNMGGSRDPVCSGDCNLSSSSMLMAGDDTGDIAPVTCVTSPLYFSGILDEAPLSALHRGRYLPDVGASCIQISQMNLESLRARQQERFAGVASLSAGSGSVAGDGADAENLASALLDRTRLRLVSEDPALLAAAAEGNVVFLSSSVDGLGTFSALTNGTIRCHFHDRTLLFLIPGVDDREENLVATCLFRDATQCSMRLVKCLPHHPMFRYVAHALQFRRFARLSPEGRTDVMNDTSALKLQLLEETKWRRENEVELELQQLICRTQALLSGNDELSHVNRSLLYGEEGNASVYFS